jgi:dTDP-4-amino-4,6-dideoxygalactose transaminase
MTTSAVLAPIKRAPRAVSSPSFPAWPHFEEDEINAACEVLRSGNVNYWTGEAGRDFEQKYAKVGGCKHGIALANGTVALELALYALGIGPGDEVITTSRTFVASASCAVMRGARPILADVDRESQNITADTIKAVLTPRTKAIIAVHLAGWPCEMDAILELANERGIKVVEDCAQAHGATYKGRPVGSMSHAAAFSFCQDKIMTTGGEGGMLTTNDDTVWETAWAFKDHGKSYRAVYGREHPPGFRWLHESFGTNWRMTEMQSAIGIVQLGKLPAWIARRREYAAILSEHLSGTPGLRISRPPSHIGHAYYKYYAFIVPQALRPGWDRDRILREIGERGVPCFSGSCSEVYLEKAFSPELRPKERLTTARELGESSLMLLVHPTLTLENIFQTVTAVREVMSHACY